MTVEPASANPGGQHRRLIRHTLKNWIDAQSIPGITEVCPGMRPEIDLDGTADSFCIVRIELPSTSEGRAAFTGPGDPGGKMLHYDATLHVHHRGVGADQWEESEDDYDRIIDALKDSIRGRGRDLGRPDVVFQVGEYPEHGGVVDRHDEPVEDGGVVDRWGAISFTVSQYLPTFIP